MIPKSLTIPLPNSYVDLRTEYYTEVKRREEILEKYRKQKEENEKLMDSYEDTKEELIAESSSGKTRKDGGEERNDDDGNIIEGLGPIPEAPILPPTIDIPSIPVPPMLTPEEGETNDNIKNRVHDDGIGKDKPPIKPENGSKTTDSSCNSSETIKLPPPPSTLLEEDKLTIDQSKGQQRISCIPETKQYLVSHLDPDCFLLPDGRYYGLTSNHIADPQFVGPNAPGISAVSTGSGTGLATSHAGGGSNVSTNYADRYQHVGGSNTDGGVDKKLSFGGKNSGAPSSSSCNNSNNNNNNHSHKSSDKGANNRSNKSSNNNNNSNSNNNKPCPTTTGTPMQLKKVMEKGGQAAQSMRESIIRAAVYASRSGAHGGSFVGANGEAYPDVSKAFSIHGNLRPCARCKNNKQGAYHCRLRRKHGERDYDGGNSAEILVALFEMALEDLVA